jgi:hypothetical protein
MLRMSRLTRDNMLFAAEEDAEDGAPPRSGSAAGPALPTRIEPPLAAQPGAPTTGRKSPRASSYAPPYCFHGVFRVPSYALEPPG